MSTNKEKILLAASALFLEGGTAALSVRAIAKRAELSTIGIYSHFEGKQGILDALYIEGFVAVEQAMSVLDKGLAPREAVAEAARNYLDLAEANRAHYSLIFGEGDSTYMPSAQAKQAGIAAFSKLIALSANFLDKEASQNSQEIAAIKIWSLMHGAVSLKHHAVAEIVDMSSWHDEVLETVLLLVDGIAANQS